MNLTDVEGNRVRAIEHVILWSNANVMVFGDTGNQVPDLQGVYFDVKDKVLESSDANTTFYHGVWREGCQRVDRKDW